MARRKRYRAEFTRQALKRADQPGVTNALVCKELGINTRQLRRWWEAMEMYGKADALPRHGTNRSEELIQFKREPAKVAPLP